MFSDSKGTSKSASVGCFGCIFVLKFTFSISRKHRNSRRKDAVHPVSRIQLGPTEGLIEIDGVRVYDNGWTGVDVRALRRQKMGVIFQTYNLIPFLTVLENVELILALNGFGQGESMERAMRLLEYLDIAHRWHHYPTEISGGEQQRVAVARALANDPAILLADEPTAALDTERGKSVMTLLRRLSREKNTGVIVVTHDKRMVEGFDRVYEIADGQMTTGHDLHDLERPTVSFLKQEPESCQDRNN